jgi:alpha-1,3-mannosyltransferase
LVLGAPFLLTYPQSYIRKAFELDRVFFYKWTVNWKASDILAGCLLKVLKIF